MTSVHALIVDSHDACLAMKLALQPLSSIFATSRKDAMELCRRHQVQFVIADQMIDGLDVGLGLLEGIAQQQHKAHAILLSASRDRAVEERARKRGIAFLRKPFGQWALQDLLTRLANEPLALRPLRMNPVLLDLGGQKYSMGPRTFAIAQLRGPFLWEGLEPAVMREFLDSLTTEDVSESLGLVSANAARAHVRRATQKAREFHGLDSLGPRALRLEILRMILEPS